MCTTAPPRQAAEPRTAACCSGAMVHTDESSSILSDALPPTAGNSLRRLWAEAVGSFRRQRWCALPSLRKPPPLAQELEILRFSGSCQILPEFAGSCCPAAGGRSCWSRSPIPGPPRSLSLHHRSRLDQVQLRLGLPGPPTRESALGSSSSITFKRASTRIG